MKNPKLITLLCWLFFTAAANAQDTLVFEDKHTYIVEIVEESESKVVYKKYPVLTDFAYVIPKRFVTDVKYFDPSTKAAKFKPDKLVKENKLELWVKKGNKGGTFNGLLHRMDDSTLILKKAQPVFGSRPKNAPEVVYILPYSQIHHIAARRQNRIIGYALGGTATGFLLGTLTGLAIFKDSQPCDPLMIGPDDPACDPSLHSPHSAWEKSLKLGFGMAGAGALAGGIYGGVKVKIQIGGRKDLFNAAVPRLRRMDRALRESEQNKGLHLLFQKKK